MPFVYNLKDKQAQELFNLINQRATALLNRPHLAYGHQRLAAAPQDLLQAEQAARDQRGAYQPGINAANELLQQGAASDFGTGVNQFLNPYRNQVAQQIQDRGLRALQEKIMPAIEGKFIRLGQHGGSRHLQATQRGYRQMLDEIMDKQANVLSHGFDIASRQYDESKNRKLRAADQTARMEPLKRSLFLSDIERLGNQGLRQQSDQQRNLDVLYQNFLQQQQYPWQQLFNYQSAISGTPMPQQSYHVEQTPPPQYQMNTAGNLGALATQALGMMGAPAAQAPSAPNFNRSIPEEDRAYRRYHGLPMPGGWW